MNFFSRVKERDKANLYAGIVVFLALCFMLFLYAPIELYAYNQDEFWFDLYDLLPVILLLLRQLTIRLVQMRLFFLTLLPLLITEQRW